MEYLIAGVLVIGVLQIGVVALAMWIGYRLVVSAVRTAILEADDARALRASTRTYSSDSTT